MLCLLLALDAAARAGVASLSLTPIADTTLSERAPDNNLGALDRILAGTDGAGFRRRGILLFDLSESVPRSAIIDSAALTLSVNTSNFNTGDFALHRMLVPWKEGIGEGTQGQPAGDGESTWNNRHHPATPWGAPGGRPGVDYVAEASASTTVSNAGSYSWEGLAADVQTMLNPCDNVGWMLISSLEGTAFTARQFESRESFNEVYPTLEIEYHTPMTGDLDLDGDTDRADAAILAAHFGATECMTWTTGDLDGDGAVTLNDWGVLQSNLPPGALDGVSVPEPATGSLAAVVAILGLARFFRNNRARFRRA